MSSLTNIIGFYIVLIGLLYIVGGITSKFVNLTEQVGALLGGLLGVAISIGLWFYVGRGMVQQARLRRLL